MKRLNSLLFGLAAAGGLQAQVLPLATATVTLKEATPVEALTIPAATWQLNGVSVMRIIYSGPDGGYMSTLSRERDWEAAKEGYIEMYLKLREMKALSGQSLSIEHSSAIVTALNVEGDPAALQELKIHPLVRDVFPYAPPSERRAQPTPEHGHVPR